MNVESKHDTDYLITHKLNITCKIWHAVSAHVHLIMCTESRWALTNGFAPRILLHYAQKYTPKYR